MYRDNMRQIIIIRRIKKRIEKPMEIPILIIC